MASAFEDIVERHDLGPILAGSDLQLTASGDIALTRDGDLKLGGDRCNAMHRLVRRWCFNARTVETLFGLVVDDNLRLEEAKREREQVAAVVVAEPGLTARFHALGEDIGASEHGGAACAGAIVVVLNNLLQRYKGDLSGVSPKWAGIEPQFNGCSFGEVITAAAANFRHHDEWLRARAERNLTELQKKSIRVIERVLSYTVLSQALMPPWTSNASADIVLVVGEGEFRVLEKRFFEFAKAMSA